MTKSEQESEDLNTTALLKRVTYLEDEIAYLNHKITGLEGDLQDLCEYVDEVGSFYD
jgi:hypothetical protein